MRKTMVKNWMVLGLLIAVTAGTAFAEIKAKDVVGEWSYEAPYAPYEYSKGKLVFTENGDQVDGKIKIGQYEIQMRNVKLEGDVVSFGAYVEGEYITVKVNVAKKEFTGTASYSEGTIDVTGKKE